ncbi:FAD-dependent oxidoreductase, partial [Streptomyces sp. NPDC007070]|uniref:FAD-dependent oxidoreductase n=1 Tax=Streptomyces sp. NPDC007070 TaxID=3154312 RepID=UPI0033E9AE77
MIVGAGFAGYRAARTLSRMSRGKADITLLNPTDYFLYLPLLPQVAAGVLEPRRVTVSLSGTLPGVRLVLGEADGVDMDARTVHCTGPEGRAGTLAYDRLVLAVGSVNKLLPIPGVAEHAHGFRGLPEALYLRDHVTRQVELAAAAGDREECAARCTFVVVGAGYTGTEVAAQGKTYTDAQVRRRPLRQGLRPRWLLLDVAPRVLPELDERLSRTADRVLRERGVDVRMGTSVREATHEGVVLTDGEFVPTRTLVWCVGVRPDPLVESVGEPLERGRLVVDPFLQVPGRPEVFACGDAAAVPDLDRPGEFTPMTAQHAWRQGRTAAVNVAASLGVGTPRPYRHRDLGFVVDLGGARAAANPLGVPLSGLAAGAVTRGYHLAAMPGNRVRVAADWLLNAVLPRQAVQLGLVRSWSVPLESASPELARVPGGPPREAEGPGGSGEGPGGSGADADASAVGADESGDTGGVPITEIIDNTEKAQLAGAEPPPHPAPNVPHEQPAPGRPGDEPARGRTNAQPASAEPRAEPASRPGGEFAKTRPGPEPAKSGPSAEPAKNQLGGEPAKSRPRPGPAKAQPGPEPARNQPGGEPGKSQPGGEPAERPPGGEPAKSERAPEPAKLQPSGEPAEYPPGGEPAKSEAAPEPAKGQPGGEPAKAQPEPEPAKSQPGGEPAKNQPGGEPAKGQPGGEPAKQPPGGEPARGRTNTEPAPADLRAEPASRPGGEPGKNQPGGEPAKVQPAPEPAKGQPGGEPAKNQPGGEPARNQPGGEPEAPRPGPPPVR